MKEHWTIGGAFRNYDLLVKFLNIVNYVEPEAVSFSVFDCPYGLTWEGGRSFIPFKGYDTTFFEKYQWFYDKKISFNFVFSNKFIETKDFDDPRGNAFLEYAHKDTNACIVSNDSFGAYIKNHYPKYKLIYSLTGTAARPSIDWYKEKLLILMKENILVIKYVSKNLLNQISQEEIENLLKEVISKEEISEKYIRDFINCTLIDKNSEYFNMDKIMFIYQYGSKLAKKIAVDEKLKII